MSKISQSSYSMGGSRRPFQILGDGEDLAVIMEEESGEQIAHVFKGVLVSSFQTTVEQDLIELSEHEKVYKEYIAGLRTVRVSLEMVANGFEFATGGNLLLDLDIFNKRSVREVLQIINRKLRARGDV